MSDWLSINPVPDPEVKAGDAVTVLDADGKVISSLLVMAVEPVEGDDEAWAQPTRLRVLRWPDDAD